MYHDPKEVFKALPHVKTIWVTKDGNFHLHPAMGGDEINRDSIENTSVVQKNDNGGEEIEPIEVINQRPKGRPKHTQ